MMFQDLNRLLDQDAASRAYFRSLPLPLQIKLQRHDGLIATEEELHRYAEFFSKLPPQA